MKKNHSSKKVWVTIKVERGFIDQAKVFESLAAARRTERSWRQRFNPDYDEIPVVESSVLSHRKEKP